MLGTLPWRLSGKSFEFPVLTPGARKRVSLGSFLTGWTGLQLQRETALIGSESWRLQAGLGVSGSGARRPCEHCLLLLPAGSVYLNEKVHWWSPGLIS